MNDVEVRPIDLESNLINRLEENGLPTEDLDEPKQQFYEVLLDSKRIGCGALQPAGTNALLRSIIIEENQRGKGLGTRLVESLLEETRRKNVETVYLLTQNASGFFETLGFEEIPRSDAPPVIQSTAQFQTLCPESATCMRLKLARDN